jgi:hypothetical protein
MRFAVLARSLGMFTATSTLAVCALRQVHQPASIAAIRAAGTVITITQAQSPAALRSVSALAPCLVVPVAPPPS